MIPSINQHPVKRFKFIIITLIVIGVILGWSGAFNSLTHWLRDSDYTSTPSLLPQVKQKVAVRFDPSFHYTGIRPAPLAKQLAEKWQAAGINLVFYRAYDPQHGAF